MVCVLAFHFVWGHLWVLKYVFQIVRWPWDSFWGRGDSVFGERARGSPSLRGPCQRPNQEPHQHLRQLRPGGLERQRPVHGLLGGKSGLGRRLQGTLPRPAFRILVVGTCRLFCRSWNSTLTQKIKATLFTETFQRTSKYEYPRDIPKITYIV